MVDRRFQSFNFYEITPFVAHHWGRGNGRIHAGQHAHEFALTLTVQTGDSQDFTLAQAAVRRAAVGPDFHFPGTQHDGPELGCAPGMAFLFCNRIFSGHETQKVLFGNFAFFQYTDVLAIA